MENPKNSLILSNAYTVSLVFSLIGGILVLLTDFAGWTEGTYYGTNDYYVFIGSENAPIYSQILVAVIAFGLLLIAYFSYQGMNEKLSMANLELAFRIAFGIVALVIFGALLFFIIASDAVSTWLDTAFYAGLIGGSVPLWFLYQIRSENL